jgi:integrase
MDIMQGKRTGRPRKTGGAYLYPHKKRNVWLIRDGAGKDISTGLRLEQVDEAQVALAEYIKMNRPSTVGQTNLGTIRVEDVLLFYLEKKKAELALHPEKQATYDNNFVNVKRLLEWWEGRVLSDVKPSTSEEYREWRKKQPNPHAKSEKALAKVAKDGTIRREGQIFNAAIHLYEDEFLKPNGIGAPRMKLPPPGPGREEYFERTEISRMLWACLGWVWSDEMGRMTHETRRTKHSVTRLLKRARRKHTSRVILIGIYTGTRHAAMIEAKWVPSLDAPYVDVEKGLYFRRGRDVVETKKRTPPCRIPDELLRHMRRWRKLDMAKGIEHVVHYNGEPMADRMRTSWKSVLADARVEKRDVHAMRHTCASWLVQAMPESGLSWEEIADYLGMTVEILKRVYGHHHPDHQKAIGEGFKAHREATRKRRLQAV